MGWLQRQAAPPAKTAQAPAVSAALPAATPSEKPAVIVPAPRRDKSSSSEIAA
jgi:hypothetical protein